MNAIALRTLCVFRQGVPRTRSQLNSQVCQPVHDVTRVGVPARRVIAYVLVPPLLQPFPLPPGQRAQAWRYQPIYRRPSHFHAEPELNLVWRGEADFTVGRRSFTLRRGDLLALPPGLDHELVSGTPDLEFFAVGYDLGLVETCRRQSGEALTLGVKCLHVPESHLQRFASFCHEVGEKPGYRGGERLLLELLRYACHAQGRPGFGARAASLVSDRSVSTREGIARALARNRGDVSRHFHRDNGVTLREFRSRMRVLEFLRHFDERTSHLTRAAFLAGFGSYSQFHRVFWEVIGCSPRDFLGSGVREEHAGRFSPVNAGIDSQSTSGLLPR